MRFAFPPYSPKGGGTQMCHYEAAVLGSPRSRIDVNTPILTDSLRKDIENWLIVKVNVHISRH